MGVLASVGLPPVGGGCVAVLGSRSLPVSALWSVFRFGRLLASAGWSVWSGGALGADSAGLAGALSVGGRVRVFLPAFVSSVPAGSGSLPWSLPRRLVSSLPVGSVVSWAAGRSGSFVFRLLARSRFLLRSLPPRSCVVVFVSSAAWAARRGGSVASVRAALRLGFVPGRSLFVFSVSRSGFHTTINLDTESTHISVSLEEFLINFALFLRLNYKRYMKVHLYDLRVKSKILLRLKPVKSLF